MKKQMYKKFRYILPVYLAFLVAVSCEDTITEYGFDGSVSGTLKDPSGLIIPGDLNSNNLVINALAEGDVIPIVIRVGGDGTFQNTKLFPVHTTISVSGPVFPVEPVDADLSGGKNYEHDIVVTPFISIDTPSVSGTPSGSSVDINYSMAGNGGKVAAVREPVSYTHLTLPTKRIV